jgi:hypothetical protein
MHQSIPSMAQDLDDLIQRGISQVKKIEFLT